jgi:hypothetical protein
VRQANLGTSGSIHPSNRDGITYLVKEEVERDGRHGEAEGVGRRVV